MESFMKNYKKLIKTIFNDVLFLYKNFIHWNISKILINISSFALWIMTSFPVFIVLIFIMWLDPIAWNSVFLNSDVNLSLDGLRMIQDNIFIVFIEWIIFSLGIGVLFLALSYKVILQLYLTRSYLKNKLLPYKENLYFNKVSFLSYIKVVWWQLLYLLIPVGIFLFFWIIILSLIITNKNLSLQMVANDPFNPFTIVGLLLFLICGFIFFYLLYRMSFSFFVLVDKIESQKNTSLEIVKKSFSLTRWYKKFLTFASIFIIFWFIMLPFLWVSSYLQDESEKMMKYITLSAQEQQKVIEAKDISDLEDLKITYIGMSIWAIKERLSFFNWIGIVYSFFIFLIFSGYMEMVFYSFYNNYLNKQKFKFL